MWIVNVYAPQNAKSNADVNELLLLCLPSFWTLWTDGTTCRFRSADPRVAWCSIYCTYLTSIWTVWWQHVSPWSTSRSWFLRCIWCRTVPSCLSSYSCRLLLCWPPDLQSKIIPDVLEQSSRKNIPYRPTQRSKREVLPYNWTANGAKTTLCSPHKKLKYAKVIAHYNRTFSHWSQRFWRK